MEVASNIVEEKIIKPENDLKEYHFVELHNKIQAFLISTKKHLEHFQVNPKLLHHKKSSNPVPIPQNIELSKTEIKEKLQNLIQSSNFQENSDEEFCDEDDEDYEDIEADEEELPAMNLENEEKGKEKRKGLASVSITVCVGSCSEPNELPGLAHLVEHIISLGCKDFPEEDAFSKFISRHGGFENAFTSLNSTTYEFDIDNEYLQEALYRFSRLLKEPLLRKEGISKEIKAIDNEFELAAADEDVQRFQVILSSFERGFPLNKFPWGNAVSLNKKDKELQNAVKKFYDTFYRPENIKVCIDANYSLSDLEDIFRKCFNDFEVKSQLNIVEEKLNTSSTKEALLQAKKSLQGCFFLKTSSQIQKISFTWAIESLLWEYQVLPLDLIMSLLNERGPGSLYNTLKKENLITDLDAEINDIDGQMNEYLFLPYLWMKLTDEGSDNIDQVIQYTGEYLNMLNSKTLPEYYYTEAKTMSQYEFKYADEVPEEDLTSSISQNIKYIPHQNLLQSGIYRVYLKEDKILLNKVLSEILLKHARIDIQAPNFPTKLKGFKTNKEVEYEFKEIYFNTKYSSLNLKDLLGEPIYTDLIEKGFYSNKFQFPERNLFIPDALTLHESGNELPLPNNIEDQDCPKQSLWHKMDSQFKIPKASVHIMILFNLKKDAKTNVYVELLEHYLSEKFFQEIGNEARKANYSCSFEKHEYCGLELSVYGFSDKMLSLLESMIDFLFVTINNIDEEVLKQIIEKRTKFYEKVLDDPEKYLKMSLIKFLFDFGLMPEEKIDLLNNSELSESFKDFCKSLTHPHHIRRIKTYTHGNLTLNNLKELANRLQAHINQTVSQDNILTEPNYLNPSLFMQEPSPLITTLRKLPPEILDVKMISHLQEQKNNMVLCYLDIGDDNLENRTLCQTLNQIFNTELFESLRMRQQIGYIANSYLLVLPNLRIGLEIWVSSSKLLGSEITIKILEFIKWFGETFLSDYSEKDFEDLRQSEISIKTKPFQTIQDAADEYWTEIKYLSLAFERKQEEIKFMKKLEFDNFKNWARNSLLSAKKISLELESKTKPGEESKDDMEVEHSEEGDDADFEDYDEIEGENVEEEKEDPQTWTKEEKEEFDKLFAENLKKINSQIEKLLEVWTRSIE